MNTTLILIGVGCIIGAIIGGGVKLVQVELSPVTSIWRQLLLGAFGIVLVAAGVMAGGSPLPGGDEKEQATSSGDKTGDKPSGDKPDDKPVDQPSVAFPARVDVFACEAGEDGTANIGAANRIVAKLRDTGRIATVQARTLSRATNAGTSYGIAGNIVRFDPGERPAAAAIARIASAAANASFDPAPALPGSPSINYLSVFVCAPH